MRLAVDAASPPADTFGPSPTAGGTNMLWQCILYSGPRFGSLRRNLDAFHESTPRRRIDRAGAFGHSRDGAGGRELRAVIVQRADDRLVRTGTGIAQRRIRAARGGAAGSSRHHN